MNVKQLRTHLDKLEADHGDIDDVVVYYRHSYDSDPRDCEVVEEDLFEEDNKTLYSIAILTISEDQ
tara:strand:+ start:849 stop:1046 length:198 start_codon:yes stop_codon:yes gene_type:complete